MLMCVRIALHGTNDTKVIHMLCNVRQQLAHHRAALAVLAKLKRRLGDIRFFIGQLVDIRLGIEGIDLRGATAHPEVNHAFGPWRKLCGARINAGLGKEILLQQRRQRQRAYAIDRMSEGCAAGNERFSGLHGYRTKRNSLVAINACK